MSDVTQILSQIEGVDGQATEKLLPLVHDELRGLAAQEMAQQDPGQTLQANALVHEAYIRLVDVERDEMAPIREEAVRELRGLAEASFDMAVRLASPVM